MTIVVGKKSNQCFSSGSFREAFKSSLVASVKAMEGDEQPSAPQKKAIDDRNARGNKLWALAERQHQATMPAARYFGQK